MVCINHKKRNMKYILQLQSFRTHDFTAQLAGYFAQDDTHV